MTHPANVLREIDYIPNMGITVPGGCNLSMRVWRPVNTLGNPIPAILEHLLQNPGHLSKESYALEQGILRT